MVLFDCVENHPNLGSFKIFNMTQIDNTHCTVNCCWRKPLIKQFLPSRLSCECGWTFWVSSGLPSSVQFGRCSQSYGRPQRQISFLIFSLNQTILLVIHFRNHILSNGQFSSVAVSRMSGLTCSLVQLAPQIVPQAMLQNNNFLRSTNVPQAILHQLKSEGINSQNLEDE